MIRQALAKDPDERYQSAGDLARAALAAVDRPSLARGVSRLVAGESAPGWHWDKPPAPRQRGVPLPAALTGELGAGPFVGRAALLERLRERYALAASGQRQVVVLAGEPGIGKSRLAIEFARETHAEGATVLFGRSDPESPVPYQPFVTAVQHAMAHRESVTLPRRAGAGAVGAGAPRPGAAPAPARAARPDRRGPGHAPLPHVRGRHAPARLPRRASARRC